MSWITAPGRVACNFQGLALGLTERIVGWRVVSVGRSADISRLKPCAGILPETCRTVVSFVWANATSEAMQAIVATAVIRRNSRKVLVIREPLSRGTAPGEDF